MIFSPARTAQQGAGKVGRWKINFMSTQKWENPLMGWTSTGDPYANVGDAGLSFDSQEAAISFSKRHCWDYTHKLFRRRLCTAATEPRTQKLERIANELLDLNKLERHDYAILFNYKMGFNRYGPAAAAPATQSAGGGASSAPAVAKEKTAFDLKLEKFDSSAKLKVIKEIRAFTELGLKEAKDLVEKTPAVFKKGVTKEEGEKIVEKLKELGATVVLE